MQLLQFYTLHLDTAIDIKNISTLYKEAHTVSHVATRLKADQKVNIALDNRLDRECNYTRRKSITFEAENTFKSAFNLNTVQGEVPGSTPEIPGLTISELGVEDPVLTLSPPENIQPTEKFINEVKSDAKSKVLVHENQNILDHVNTLIKQGHFLKLTLLEQIDVTWKSFIYNLPRSTMKWVLNSSIDTLTLNFGAKG